MCPCAAIETRTKQALRNIHVTEKHATWYNKSQGAQNVWYVMDIKHLQNLDCNGYVCLMH